MAKKRFQKKKIVGSTDRSIWYSDLAYLPPEQKKSAIWMAQMIFYGKRNSTLLVDPSKAEAYRKNDKGIINKNDYKKIIDPPTPKGGGGTAEFFVSDWQSYPIDQHLDNVTSAALEKIPHNINVKVNDPIAKLQEQLDKEKIITQGYIRNIINHLNQEIGLPIIDESVDPYKWMQKVVSSSDGDKEFSEKIDTIGNTVDLIRNKIKNDDQLRMFMKYVYKNGLEIAFESAINYYFINAQKWYLKQDYFIRDIKHHNTACGMWYIDQTTGRPVLKYLDPSCTYTSPFYEKNGDDIIYWGTEFLINFADFEKMVGATLRDEEKLTILQLNKMWSGSNSSYNINNIWNDKIRTNAQMKIGYFSVLTQDSYEFSEYFINNEGSLVIKENPKWDSDVNNINEQKKCKTYNVWYNAYYIPLPDSSIPNNIRVGTSESWEWLSKYVFNVHKEIDMYRYGVDSRYAKSSLVVYKDDTRMSYTQIKERFMPQINILWHKIQNCLVQDINAMGWDYDLLAGILNAVEDANEKNGVNGGNALLSEMRSLKQSGLSWLKFRDKNGALLVEDPSKLFVSIKSGHMAAASDYMMMILTLYNQMIQSLAISPASSGQQPDPRTPAKGIEIAAQATDQARWFMEKPMIEITTMFGERVIQYVNNLCKEKKAYNYKERWDEFVNVVGFANGATIEGIEKIDFENIAITVVNENDAGQRQVVTNYLMQKVANKEISTTELELILSTNSWKLQLMEIAMAEEKRKEEAEELAEANHRRTMEQISAQQELAKQLQASKTQSKLLEIQAEGEVEAKLTELLNQVKFLSQRELIRERGEQKKEAAYISAELEKEKDRNRKNLEEQNFNI